MKAYAITLGGHTVSEAATAELIRSSHLVGNDFVIVPFKAVRAENADTCFSEANLKWSYPWHQPKIDMVSGCTLSPYRTADPRKRIACFLSHYKLWEECVKLQENILVLEHDAVFTSKLDYDIMDNNNYGVIGINDPRGATRKSIIYHNMIQESKYHIQPVPRIDTALIPQGLAGNSAYIIKPWAAKEVIETVKRIGAWPNDALLCYQNFKMNFLGVTKKYYTKVQGTPSTTTL